MKKTFRILIADDHPLLTAGLKLAVEGWEEFTLVGAASSGEEAVALCETAAPDVVLMDMQLPGISGAEAAAAIKARRPQARVVALTPSTTGKRWRPPWRRAATAFSSR